MELLTENAVHELLPRVKNSQEWHTQLNEILPGWEINTERRVAAFIAQCGHESMGFTRLIENLNYSSKALNAVFPKYFKNAGRDAEEYHRQPEKIANVIYANRMGNGDTDSGEGWRYRGRGIIQITGKNNYTNCSQELFSDETLLENPDLLCEVYYAIHSACWYWKETNLNKYADDEDLKTMTRKINGGYIGLEDRIKHYNHAIEVIKD
tara:strand:+ start:251 stop:877 length:627 start_codon:yes stop_codon:yes gene_type:complete